MKVLNEQLCIIDGNLATLTVNMIEDLYDVLVTLIPIML